MKKNDADYLLEKQNISAQYIQPLLNELNTLLFSQKEIIQVFDTLVKLANGVYFLIGAKNDLPNIFKNRTLNRFIKVLNDQCVLLSSEDLKLNNLQDILFHNQDVGRFIPPIITVSYIGSVKKLEFQDELLNNNRMYISYVTVSSQAVLPLSALVFLPIPSDNDLLKCSNPRLQNIHIAQAPDLMDSCFLQYKLVSQFNYLDPSRKNMFHCLKILDNKCEDLGRRGFKKERDRLQLLKEEIDKKMNAFEKKTYKPRLRSVYRNP
ncbi:hypothetical protein [Legionella drancourtii]|uniref:Uncharacterized protein n=1 Tax=Legionella drancourtii LLAP12 TaxID=658187 RepID=G9EKK2_9GAMM|nr:hypothetical protein [Legionella drancourtii]EHL32353.1 hypothetical protein LDG_5737 [Legionella drancourtii LLAP12]